MPSCLPSLRLGLGPSCLSRGCLHGTFFCHAQTSALPTWMISTVPQQLSLPRPSIPFHPYSQPHIILPPTVRVTLYKCTSDPDIPLLKIPPRLLIAYRTKAELSSPTFKVLHRPVCVPSESHPSPSLPLKSTGITPVASSLPLLISHSNPVHPSRQVLVEMLPPQMREPV